MDWLVLGGADAGRRGEGDFALLGDTARLKLSFCIH